MSIISVHWYACCCCKPTCQTGASITALLQLTNHSAVTGPNSIFSRNWVGRGGLQTQTHSPSCSNQELPSHSSDIKSCPVIQDIFVVIKASLVGQCSMCESQQTLTSQRPYNLTGTSEGSQMKTCCQRSQKIHWFWQTLCQDCVLQTIIVPSVCFFVIGASRWNTH